MIRLAWLWRAVCLCGRVAVWMLVLSLRVAGFVLTGVCRFAGRVSERTLDGVLMDRPER